MKPKPSRNHRKNNKKKKGTPTPVVQRGREREKERRRNQKRGREEKKRGRGGEERQRLRGIKHTKQTRTHTPTPNHNHLSHLIQLKPPPPQLVGPTIKKRKLESSPPPCGKLPRWLLNTGNSEEGRSICEVVYLTPSFDELDEGVVHGQLAQVCEKGHGLSSGVSCREEETRQDNGQRLSAVWLGARLLSAAACFSTRWFVEEHKKRE